MFGSDALELNFSRNSEVLGKMLTFNGNENDISDASKRDDYDTPPRRCPGYGYALDIIQFLVDRYAPQECSDAESYITQERFEQIGRKETGFMKFVLKMGKKTYAENNRYFPHASEVKHPLDTRGKALSPTEIAVGGIRSMPEYGTSEMANRLGNASFGALRILTMCFLFMDRRGRPYGGHFEGRAHIRGSRELSHY